jgi:hypothetical protein
VPSFNKLIFLGLLVSVLFRKKILMKKLCTLFLFLICCVVNSYGQKYLPATLHYNDGHSAKVLLRATPPSGKKVVAKASEDAKKEKIASELLKQIVFEVEDSEPVIYEMHSLDLAGRIRDKQWVQVMASGAITLYGQGGEMGMMRAGAPHSVTDITFYARRNTEEHASYLGAHITPGAIPIGYNKQFRKFAGRYFSDYPALAERIDNKEFKVSDAIQVVEEYNKWAK